MKKSLLFCALLLLQSAILFSQADDPYTTCPNVNIALLRAGFNADDTNPYNLYNVNTLNGSFTMVPGGPYKDPADPTKNLQVNGIGINAADGFIYGLSVENTVTTARFLRMDKTYGVTSLGFIPSPAAAFGQVGFVNTAAGDLDNSGNYYFTAGVINVFTGQITNLYLGKIANVASYISGPVAVEYFEILTSAGCASYISTFNSDPQNSGLKDFSYNPFNKTFYSYATYKPSGASQFSGQVIKLQPISGSSPLQYELICTPVINNHTTETSGTLIDNAGNFLVMMTDGTVGKIASAGSFDYTGQYIALNNSTGLPNPLRGDMATCSAPAPSPLPVHISSFTVAGKDCKNQFTWISENEIGFSRYELEQSLDNLVFKPVTVVEARRSLQQSSYQVTIPSAGRQAFYRLKMIDTDGRFAYSKTLQTNGGCAEKFGFNLSPNPADRQVNLNWFGLSEPTQVDVIVFNTNGVMVSRISRSLPAGTSIMNVDITTLPKGTYLITAIDTKNNESFQTRFIKQ